MQGLPLYCGFLTIWSLQMRPAFLEAHLKREPATVQKYQLLWQFYVKNGQPLRAAEVLGALAESDQYVCPFIFLHFAASSQRPLQI
jgi:hypothetical protein